MTRTSAASVELWVICVEDAIMAELAHGSDLTTYVQSFRIEELASTIHN